MRLTFSASSEAKHTDAAPCPQSSIVDTKESQQTASAIVFIGMDEPVWSKCETCSRETMRAKCIDCQTAADNRFDRIESLRLLELSIPKRFAWATLTSPDLPSRVRTRMPPVQIARDHIFKSPMTLLSGSAGCGKTSLAVACLRDHLRTQDGGVYVDASDLAAASFQHSLGKGESELYKAARDAKFLVLDELKWPGFEARAKEIERLINHRHGASESRTIVTTALSPDQILKSFGDGVHRRLCEKSSALHIRLGADQK